MKDKLSVAFIHLDLGVGGAERLIVSAASALQEVGHSVIIYTSRCEKPHPFSSINEGALKVRVIGSFLPLTLFGRFQVFFAMMKALYVALYLFICGIKYDVIFNDVTPNSNFILRYCCSCLIFYCHYPDLLLCVNKQSILRRLYRLFFDTLEIYSMQTCDIILTNSYFTANTCRGIYKNLKNLSFIVIYPPIDIREIEEKVNKIKELLANENSELDILNSNDNFFLSLNRYERKKNVNLAIEAFYHLKKNLLKTDETKVKLVIAGGFDSRVNENITYYEELENLAKQYNLEEVLFLRNISDKTRWLLLLKATCLIYTPKFEHFGIVPCEAMAVGTPVVTSNSGGPKESVVHEKTGFLCNDTVEDFAEAMHKILNMKMLDKDAYKLMQEAAKKRIKFFGSEEFVKKLNGILEDFASNKKNNKRWM